MTARKTAKKTPAKKPSKGKTPSATESDTPKKAPAKKAAAKKATAPKAAKAKPAKKPAAAEVSARSVNMGNVFALRPRVSKTFRQEDFLKARRLLEDETYGSVEEAARAVAERALALSNEPLGKRGRNQGR